MNTAAAPAMGLPRALVSLGLAMATFMQVLDSTIANVSLPTIAGDLGVSADQGTWVITSFAVSNAISVPLSGWLVQRYGLVRTFVMSVLLFTLASFLCGVAWSLPSLIVFRVVQGAVSGPMIPGSQALLLAVFPAEKKGAALALWSMTMLVAPICGPILGGYISDNYSWPWIFLINVPVGLVCAALCWLGLSARETPTRRLPIDVIGLALLVIWVGCLQVMLDIGKDDDWFESTRIVVLAAIVAIGFIAFIIWEIGEQHPIVDLSLFKNRNFAIGTSAFCLGYGVFLAMVVLQPLWMQTWLGYTATWAGLIAAPSGVVALLLSPLIGKLIGRYDARLFATVAFLAFSTSYFMRAGYTADASFSAFLMPLLVQGIGMATFFVGMVALLLDGVPPAQIPAASGLSNFARLTGGSFAVSLVTTFWDRHAALHQLRLAETSSVYDLRMQLAQQPLTAAGLSDSQALGVLSRALGNQAYLMSALDMFWIGGWVSLLLIAFIWTTRRPKGGAPVAAAD